MHSWAAGLPAPQLPAGAEFEVPASDAVGPLVAVPHRLREHDSHPIGMDRPGCQIRMTSLSICLQSLEPEPHNAKDLE